MALSESRNSQDRVRTYRQRMRARGLRPIQIWVPDTRSAAFCAEAHRQSLAVAMGEGERQDQAFIDAISEPAPDPAAPDPAER